VDETSLIETGPDIVLDSLSALEQDAAPVDAEAFDTGVSVTEEAVADIGPEVAAETEDVVLGSLSAPEQDAALVDVETFDTGASVTEEAVADIGPEVAAEANDVVLDGLSTPAQDSVLVDAETFGTGASVTEEVVADLEPEVAAEDLCNTSVGCLDTDADAVDDITMEEAMALEEADQDETMEAEGSEPVALVESPDRNKEVSEPVHIEDNARPCSLPVGKAPDWAGEEVNCVVIQVHGINVAIPMEQIESTRKLADISLEIDLEREWILGQLRSGDHTITYILDGGCWLMPELHDPDKANYQDLIMLPGGYWGIACDEMVRSVRIPVDEVSWAVNRSKRPWLLGTYMKERCAILDVDTLVDQLNAAF
ncbi:MAG: hypothetical protein OIF57_02395, partial [Marinobacterium sp.]|nr:hypothetical protein [Marinobacterium sp.]